MITTNKFYTQADDPHTQLFLHDEQTDEWAAAVWLLLTDGTWKRYWVQADDSLGDFRTAVRFSHDAGPKAFETARRVHAAYVAQAAL